LTSTDPRERRIGEENRDNIQQALGNLVIFPFTQRLGMSIQDVRALVASARDDAANPELKPYFPLSARESSFWHCPLANANADTFASGRNHFTDVRNR